MTEEEILLRAIAQAATGAERLGLSRQELREACAALYRADDLEQVERLTALLPPAEATPLAPLDEVAVREELRPLDCHLERTYPAVYAGFRLSEGNTLVEFGYLSELRRHVSRVRSRVSFPTRVAGFAARYALVDLRYTYVTLHRNWDALRARLDLTSLHIDVDRNAVVAGIGDGFAEATEALRAEFGAAVVTEHHYGAAG